MAALDLVLFVDDHVVAQVVEAELVVCAVGYVGVICFFAGGVVKVVDDKADFKAEEAVYLAHPLGVAACKVVVDRYDVHAVARKRVKVSGQSRHEGFAFAGFHFGYAPLVEHYAAYYLYRKVLHAEHAVGGLAARGKSLGEYVVECFAA